MDCRKTCASIPYYYMISKLFIVCSIVFEQIDSNCCEKQIHRSPAKRSGSRQLIRGQPRDDNKRTLCPVVKRQWFTKNAFESVSRETFLNWPPGPGGPELEL